MLLTGKNKLPITWQRSLQADQWTICDLTMHLVLFELTRASSCSALSTEQLPVKSSSIPVCSGVITDKDHCFFHGACHQLAGGGYGAISL